MSTQLHERPFVVQEGTMAEKRVWPRYGPGLGVPLVVLP